MIGRMSPIFILRSPCCVTEGLEGSGEAESSHGYINRVSEVAQQAVARARNGGSHASLCHFGVAAQDAGTTARVHAK
jgi:hypothetical protein